MDRRTFLTRLGATSAMFALPAAQTLPAYAMSGAHTNFHFLTIARNPVGTDMLAISGDGSVNPAQAVGGGFWQHFDNDPALPLPKPVIGCGSWHVKRLDSFDLIGDWGCASAGTVILGARFVEESGLRFSAVVTMHCNLGFAGLSTGFPEGAFVDIPDFGLAFEPATFPGGFPFGLTVFTNINESRGG